MIKRLIKMSPYLAWAIALLATFGSLAMSEYFHMIPCVLCWYQRILIYPLVLIIPVGILKKDPNLPYYILPMSMLGALIALYHSLLQWHIITERLAPCTNGVSCVTAQIHLLGFITIPFLSLLAFLSIASLSVAMVRMKPSE